MKILLLFFLTVSLNVVSQELIHKKDGTKITVSDGATRIESSRKKIAYRLNGDQKVYRIKFKDLNFASYGGFLFRTFTVNKKVKGYFVLSEHNNKTLVSSRQIRTKSRGGFESTYSFYEIAVLDNESNVVQTLSFSDENSEKNIVARSQVIQMIKDHFGDCQRLLERVSLFESPSSDSKNTTILAFMNDPKNVNCE